MFGPVATVPGSDRSRLVLSEKSFVSEDRYSTKPMFIETLIRDIRYGARNLLKHPGFTLIAIVTLGIGIAANTAVFSLVNALLFRARPVAQPERLVEMYVGDSNNPYTGGSYPDYLIFKEQRHIFSGLAAYQVQQFKLGGAEDVQLVMGEAVSGNYFDVLGVNAWHGRTFAPEEDQVPGANPVVVISHSFWQRHFGSNPAVVGQTITLNRQALTVIGVAPPQYTGMMRGLGIDVWVPLAMIPQMRPEAGLAMLNSRGNQWLLMVGRLAPEATLEQARATFDLISRQLQDAFPEYWRFRRETTTELREKAVTILPESETRIHPGMHEAVYAGVALLLVMINLVLLIACINLAGFLLARALGRRREIAVRLALGASRRTIIKQLLTESVLLALGAGVVGALLAMWLTNLLVTSIPTLPQGIRVALDLEMDWAVLIYTLGFSVLVGLSFGLVPALQASRPNVIGALKEGSDAFAGGYAQSRLRNVLIATQVAFALLLLTCAGLAMRSLRNITPTRLGFESENIVVAPIELEAEYDRNRSHQFYRQVEERALAIPGVRTASFIDELPGGFLGSQRASVGIEGYQAAPGESREINYNTIGAGYLAAMNIPVVEGREFDARDRDGAPCVAVVNESFVRRYFTDGRALGKNLDRYKSISEREKCQIVGVARDNKVQSLQKEPLPWFALPLYQTNERQVTMLVYSNGPPDAIVPAVRTAIRSVDRNVTVTDVLTLNQTFEPFLFMYQLFGIVIGACGALAVVLASLGIYGTVVYAVSSRTREIGIRVALGANKRDILRLVIGQGMIRVVYGLGIGILLALALTRVLTSSMFGLDLLYGVSANDPVTFVAVAVILSVVTLLACYIPARRAAKVDPLVALRYE